MYPKLFEIPFTGWPVPSYGLMMVIGFLVAVSLIRHLSRDITPDPRLITNAALYSLIAGVAGARLFFVIHDFDSFRDDPLSIFAIWRGGLELLGGLLALVVIYLYIRFHKLPVRKYFDIIAIALMLALAIGRIGCFLNGCCFGRPTNLSWPWAVRFPYHSPLHVHSPAYYSQAHANLKRNRPQPQLDLPEEFFGYYYEDGKRFFGCRSEKKRFYGLKPYEDLTPEQKYMVDKGPYRCLPVHPTQLYSSANGAVLCLILYLFWRRSRKAETSRKTKKLFAKPGCTFALMFILYGIARFFMEFLRDDNPFEFGWWTIYKGGTVSQNLVIYMVILGVVLMFIFEKAKSKT